MRFGDTDAAGVMHFHHLLRWCHEAWEESLETYGMAAKEVFPNSSWQNRSANVALPIVRCQADFFHPIEMGDNLLLELRPKRLGVGSFEVQTNFLNHDINVAKGRLRHLSINAETRQRCVLPELLDRWLEASSLGLGVQSL